MNPASLPSVLPLRALRNLPPRSRALLHAGAPRGGCSAIHEDSKNGQLAPLNG
ncbi:hypothetical protein EJ02DRAFT_454953, partial [Clathrospora elynae]